MCGFVGYTSAGAAQRPELLDWGQSIGHRGPNQAGAAQHGPFGIGTRRLSILDLSPLGNQPMESRRYVLGFNGEIYNHLELRRELETLGHTFRSGSDTETVLYACEAWGVHQALKRLNGIYALALWDKRQETLTLVRDPLGVKPLYFLPHANGLYFASELKALRPFSNGTVSQEATALFLFFGFVPAPYTFLQGVSKVRAGEVVIYTEGKLERHRVQPKPWEQGEAAPVRAKASELRQAVEAAVQRQLLADVPVGVFLSGGVDSSIIAAVAAKFARGLASFSVRPNHTDLEPGATRDAEIAARFARQLGLSHHEVTIGPSDFLSTAESLPHLMDEPSSEPYVLAEVLLSQAARDAGIPVVLTGHGADEVFLGYPSYGAARLGAYYNRVPLLGPVAKTLSQLPFIPAHRATNLSGLASVWRQAPLERYATVSAVTFDFETTRRFGLDDAFVRGLVEEVIQDTADSLGDLPRGSEISAVEQLARLDLRLKVPEHYNSRLDKASMSASVEARVPFQDLELVGYVASLKDRDLLRGGLKGLLKEAFKDVLPEEVVQRPKQTFQAPVLSWLQGPLAEWSRAKLAALPTPPSLVDPAGFTTAKQANRAWNLTALETWREAFGLSYQ